MLAFVTLAVVFLSTPAAGFSPPCSLSVRAPNPWSSLPLHVNKIQGGSPRKVQVTLCSGDRNGLRRSRIAQPMSSSSTSPEAAFESLGAAPEKMEPQGTPKIEFDDMQAVITRKLELLSRLLTQAREERERSEILENLCLLEECSPQ